MLIEKNRKGQDSVDGVAIRYGKEGPGIESPWGHGFCTPFMTGPGDHPGSYTMCTESYPEEKRTERSVDHPHYPAPKLKRE